MQLHSSSIMQIKRNNCSLCAADSLFLNPGFRNADDTLNNSDIVMLLPLKRRGLH